jgi:hypothetical protein
MIVHQRPSGILVAGMPEQPKPPEPPAIEYGPCEVRDPAARQATADALAKLWTATGLRRGYRHLLSHPHGETPEMFDAREHAFYQFSHLLLGDRDDSPTYEQLT